jgi:uncharacterized protein (DUF697 family)
MTERELGAMQKVNRYALYSAAAGLVPIPLFDVAAIAGVQVKLLSVLAKHYDLPFSADRGKALVSALIGGLLPTTLGYGVVGSMVKRVPVVGTIIGIFTVSVFASASTYAVGKVFIQHFESGGTFLDFNPDEVRAHFSAEFQKAKENA